MTSDVAGQESGRPAKAKVFISYSRRDMAFADRLEAALKSRGFAPLIDRSDIHAFEDWWKRIEALIAQADTVVFVLSPDSVVSEVARREIEFAASLNKRFAPIVCRPVDDKAIPDVLARLNFIIFDDETRFEAGVDRLADALSTDIGWIRRHTEFGEQARRWSLSGQPNGLLLRSPVLEEAEQWIAARPEGAPAPTGETQDFVRDSRSAATRRRNVLTGSLGAGLIVALVLAGLAYWQRGIARTNEAIAKEERDRAERNFGIARQTADGLVFDIAQGLRNVIGMPSETVRRILETAKGTFEKLSSSAPDDAKLQGSRAIMLDEFGQTYKALGNLDAALQSHRDGLTIRERFAALDRTNDNWQRQISISCNLIGDVLVEQRKPDEALEFYRRGLATAERLASLDRDNTERQRDLSISQEKIGDVLLAQGKLGEALQVFRNSLAIRERLAAAKPDNVQLQRDLAVAYHKIGEALVSGDLHEALKAYRNSLATVERLATADPSNAQLQRDLSAAHEKVGDVLLAQGKVDEALKAHRASLAATERLVAADRDNMQWRRGLSVSYIKIGDILKIQGKLDDALKSYRDSFAVMERLVSLDRSNANWQRDLSIAYDRIGDVLMQQDKLDEALEAYRNSLAIIGPLAASNSANPEWQRALSVSYDRMGDVLKAQEKFDEALEQYRDSLAIRQRLAATQPGNAKWQHDLYISHTQIGDVLETWKKFDEALKAYRDSLAIIEPLAAANPSNIEWQRDLAISHQNIGDVLRAQDQLDAALAAYRDSLAIRQRLAALHRNNEQLQRDLRLGIYRIADLAYRFVRAGQFATGLAVADEAIALRPDDVSFYATRAYALMFLDRADEARAIFLRYRGTRNVLGKKPWEAVVLEDYADLRKAGHSNPLMDEIEKRFAAGG